MKKNGKKLWALLLAVILVFGAVGCTAGKGQAGGDTITVKDGETIGEGSKSITVEVVDGEGKAVTFTVKTDEKTVGGALQAVQVLSGEQGDYGLYIKTVNGITADYDKDGTYWAFYIGGEYAMTGVDMTDLTDGGSYTLKVEK